ncbi:IS200/IS605 family transposase [Salinimicrobium oceani]|uniref:IS200/IS605 family transposase n=1 Tax=Salinimicrobium oceani TaxID=2722702 RepID=A0ABX1D0J3_9FLAO|nr:IS200/IS605 family transposase [Salinimicrobium oceani]NJW54020.1 IS200/IS605 family transposase [Salinimicrobium oceani]
MANTYTQIHLQLVFAVKFRSCLIQPSWKDELYKYITGIISSNEHKLLAIGGMPDHLHILIGMRPDQSVSQLLKEVKGSSSKWINERKFLSRHFSWQEGFGAFSYSKSDLPKVISYIQHQEEHHRKKNFQEEYLDLLKEFQVKFDERYILKNPT